MASLTLYNYFRSSTSYRIRIVLALKKLEYEYKPINLLKGEQRSSDYLKVNPLGGVPALVHNGKTISESMAIAEYLDEVFPENPLLPKDPYAKSLVRQVCEIINSFMHPLGNAKVLNYLGSHHAYSQDEKNEWVQLWAKQGLSALENILSKYSEKYCFGNSLTFADTFLVPQLLTCERFKVDLSPYPTLLRINENCLRLEAFKKANPFIQMDTPEDLRSV